MLKTYTDQVFTIGTVNNSAASRLWSTPIAQRAGGSDLRWEPTAYFGVPTGQTPSGLK